MEKFHIGTLPIDEYSLGFVLDTHMTIGLIIGEDLIINSVAKILNVKSKDIVFALNEIDTTLMDTFTFMVFEIVRGDLDAKIYDEVLEFSMKHLGRWIWGKKGDVKSYRYTLSYATTISQIDMLRRFVKLGKGLELKIPDQKYKTMRRGWIIEMVDLVKKVGEFYNRKEKKGGIDFEDIAELVKGYMGAGK